MMPAIDGISVVVSDSLPTDAKRFVGASLDNFVRAWGEIPVTVTVTDDDELFALARAGDVDFFFADAGTFAALERFGGSRALLSAASNRSTDPQQADGLTILVPQGTSWQTLLRDDRDDILEVSARDASLLTMLLREAAVKHGADERQVNLLIDRVRTVRTDDLSASAGKEDSDGSSRSFSSGDSKAEENATAMTRAKLVRACALEDNPKSFSPLGALEPAFSPGLRCRVSVLPIPGPVLGATFRADAEQAALLRNMFLAVFETNVDWHWTQPADFRTLHDRLAQFDDRYRELARPTAEALWRQFGPYLFGGAVVICVLLSIAFSLERSVKRRTKDLVKALQAKEAADARFRALERASVVSQMSSIVAHEIRQPLAALRNYVGSLRLRLGKNRLRTEDFEWALGRMRSEIERADQIVEHVRNYAKRTDAARERLSLSDLIRDTAGAMTVPGLSLAITPGIRMEADRLEVQLIVENLLKNARDAADPAEPKVRLELALLPDNRARLVVEDNGSVVSDEVLAHISQPLYTTKAGGLGLGLSIVRRLVESYDGSSFFGRTDSGSLCVVLTLPILPEEDGASADESAQIEKPRANADET